MSAHAKHADLFSTMWTLGRKGLVVDGYHRDHLYVTIFTPRGGEQRKRIHADVLIIEGWEQYIEPAEVAE